MATKKTKTNGVEWGSSLVGSTHKWDEGPAIGRIERVELVAGGRYDNTRSRVHLLTLDGESVAAYLPESHAGRLAPFTGSLVRIERNGKGVESRYDVRPEMGAKRLATVPEIPTVTLDAREERKGRARANLRPKGKARGKARGK